jgi:hypothetical protein
MRWIATACLSLALASPVGAEGSKLEDQPASAARAAVIAFGARHPDCREWTDGCVICIRGAEAANCSTPGIACQPDATICTNPAR